MSNVTALRTRDPKQELIDKVGDLGGFRVFNKYVLLAKYVRPQKTKGGIILTDNTRKEDVYQSKIHLVVGLGHIAFKDDKEAWFPKDARIGLHDWVLCRASDGWDMQVNGVDCKLVHDERISGRVSDPDMIW